MPRGNTPHRPTRHDAARAHPSRAPRRYRAGARAAVLVTALALVGALTGCTGTDPAPEWTPTPATPITQPTPTPSADPATIKPERPTAMNTIDSAGAEAAARYFLALYPYAYATGDLSEWQALSHPDCVFCGSVVTNVEALKAAGHHNRGSEISVLSVSVQELAPGRRYGAELTVTEGPSAEVDESGAIVGEHPESRKVSMVLALAYEDGWSVLEVDATPAES